MHNPELWAPSKPKQTKHPKSNILILVWSSMGAAVLGGISCYLARRKTLTSSVTWTVIVHQPGPALPMGLTWGPQWLWLLWVCDLAKINCCNKLEPQVVHHGQSLTLWEPEWGTASESGWLQSQRSEWFTASQAMHASACRLASLLDWGSTIVRTYHLFPLLCSTLKLKDASSSQFLSPSESSCSMWDYSHVQASWGYQPSKLTQSLSFSHWQLKKLASGFWESMTVI